MLWIWYFIGFLDTRVIHFGYVWTRFFFIRESDPQQKIYGYKNIGLHVDGALNVRITLFSTRLVKRIPVSNKHANSIELLVFFLCHL